MLDGSYIPYDSLRDFVKYEAVDKFYRESNPEKIEKLENTFRMILIVLEKLRVPIYNDQVFLTALITYFYYPERFV